MLPGPFAFLETDMKISTPFLVAAVVAAALAWPAPARAQSPAGLWDAVVTVTTNPNDPNPVTVDVPFRFEIACGASCASPSGSFFNGDERVTSTTGRMAGDALVLSFDE